MNASTSLRAPITSAAAAALTVKAPSAAAPVKGRLGAGRARTLVMGALLSLLCLLLTALAVPASAKTSIEGSPAPVSQVTADKGSSSFQLRFHNYYNQSVSVAIMYRDYSGACDNYGGWATKGWWNIEPGGERYVLNTTNRHVYFYAHTANNQVQWTGPDNHMYVSKSAFNSCRDIGVSTWNYVGLRHINMGSTFTNYTFPLYVN